MTEPTIVWYGGPDGGWWRMPDLFVFHLPARYHGMTATAVAEALFDLPETFAIFGRETEWGTRRVDAHCLEMATNEPFDAEITPEWIRLYLRPATATHRTDREWLARQPLQATATLERLRRLLGQEAT